MDERDDYVLGRNVTKQALGKERLTSVVSIRMTSEEMDAVSAVAEREGKTFAQVAREAIREMTAAKRRNSGWSAAMSLSNGARFGFGDLGPLQSVHDYRTTVVFASVGANAPYEEQGAVLDATAGRGL